MSTILTSAIVQNAQGDVNTYVTTVTNLNQQLEQVINTLVANSFQGDASVGYKEFYDKKIVPAIGENLIAPNTSLTAMINSMLDSIQQQLLNTVDPNLGDNNRELGGGAAASSGTV